MRGHKERLPARGDNEGEKEAQMPARGDKKAGNARVALAVGNHPPLDKGAAGGVAYRTRNNNNARAAPTRARTIHLLRPRLHAPPHHFCAMILARSGALALLVLGGISALPLPLPLHPSCFDCLRSTQTHSGWPAIPHQAHEYADPLAVEHKGLYDSMRWSSSSSSGGGGGSSSSGKSKSIANGHQQQHVVDEDLWPISPRRHYVPPGTEWKYEAAHGHLRQVSGLGRYVAQPFQVRPGDRFFDAVEGGRVVGKVHFDDEPSGGGGRAAAQQGRALGVSRLKGVYDARRTKAGVVVRPRAKEAVKMLEQMSRGGRA
ncbi:hypothetical protein IE81DRAFT_248358 [Ceraceosorus guamensis]|uniref:Uncharacterized protein n=1 Tax=Ceraceosorus guamensis TaxID=1522189 RepID=A0A316VQK7_9BASI|nr:hypothetical protein IE81DRAFT_248358 [Ceraceosorus guamensis]PWN39929.1 hypothetical protein IE81DRAFT_248358 [Ceraceosorus guamensis]